MFFSDNQSINLNIHSKLAKAVLRSIVTSLIGPEGQTWSMEVDRSRITLRVADAADLVLLEQRLGHLKLREPCGCAGQPCTCQSLEEVSHAV